MLTKNYANTIFVFTESIKLKPAINKNNIFGYYIELNQLNQSQTKIKYFF